MSVRGTWPLVPSSWKVGRVDGAAIAVFRMAFGAIILFEVASYFRRGLIDRYFVEPVFNFTYPGFGWLLLAEYPNWTRHFGKHVMTFQKGVKQWSPSGGARMVAVVSVQSFANRLFFERAVRSNQLRISVVVLGGEAAKWLSDLTKVSHELALTAPAYEISTVLSSTALPGPIFTSHRRHRCQPPTASPNGG
jgi:hypothetical protein